MPINLSYPEATSTSDFYTRIHLSQRKHNYSAGAPPSVLDFRDWLANAFPQGGSGLSMLDVGCGINAFASNYCVKKGFSDVNAVDINPDIGNYLKDTSEWKHIKFKYASALELPFPDNSFDFVWCGGVAHHTPDPIKACSELARVTRPGGKMCVAMYCFNNSPFLSIVRLSRALGKIIPYRVMHGIFKGIPSINNFMLDHMYVPLLWVFTAGEMRSLIKSLDLELEDEDISSFDFFQNYNWLKWMTGDGLACTFYTKKPTKIKDPQTI